MPPTQPTDWLYRISEAVARLSDDLRGFAANLLNRVDRHENRLDKIEAKLDKLYDAQASEAVTLAQLPHDTAVEVRSEVEAAFGKLQLHMSESIERRRDTIVVASERGDVERGEPSKKLPILRIEEDGEVASRADVVKKLVPWILFFATLGGAIAHIVQGHGK